MSLPQHEVPEPILCSPYEEPTAHWHILEHEPPERRGGRRPAMYFYRPPGAPATADEDIGTAIELKLVNRIRRALAQWRPLALRGEGGVSRTTMELLGWWRREGRTRRLFFAQLEAAETVVFLNEARADFLQGIVVPTDEPSEERRAEGYRAFRRLCCKMATGSGKTTVMGMVAAWSILNKVNDARNRRYSDTVLVVCPNVTIKNRLAELDPELGEASLYRTRDLVPSHLMPALTQGKVIVTNWHRFEPQGIQTAGVAARVNRAGRPVRVRETIRIGEETRTVRGSRYISLADLERQQAAGLLTIVGERRDRDGALSKIDVESVRYVESDTAVVERILGREVGGKRNILVMNDEAHHAYRIRRQEPDEGELDTLDDEEADAFFREATVWVDGLDRVHKLRGIDFCLDLSATPYYLGRVGQDTNRIFPWTVSDFGLVDAIESGLTKIPQLAVRDTSGNPIPGYFNIWRWILPKLTPAERGGRKEIAKPEAVLKYANLPIAMMAGLWDELRQVWERDPNEPRPPVLILVCKNTKLAKVVYEWLAEDRPPVGVPPANVPALRNSPDCINTVRVDSKVVQETDSGEARSDEMRWMRLMLDTVGKTAWPTDRLGRPIYPPGFEELAQKLARPLYPPGRDVRCIVSVGMLTEGWDCSTVTHILGLRPFMSQLLCEQVVGRGLRRASYAVDAHNRLSEEVAQVFGVPFQIVPFKQTGPSDERPKPPKTWRIHALPERAEYEIRFPRVEGYTQALVGRIRVDWERIAPLHLTPDKFPPEVEMKAGLPSNSGRPSLLGPGRLATVDLNPFRRGHRMQGLTFDLARDLTRDYLAQPTCTVPAHVLFPQIVAIVRRYLDTKVIPSPPAERVDAFLSPYYGWMIERLVQEIRPVEHDGAGGEVARCERNRGPGSTWDVDYRTRREPYPVLKCHVNAVVPDTDVWEQSAAYRIDRHPAVRAFVKNAGLGFAIPYLHNGQPHDYLPDFVVRLATRGERYAIVETKGFDPLKEIKSQAANRWVAAVNREGSFGFWSYATVSDPAGVDALLHELLAAAERHRPDASS